MALKCAIVQQAARTGTGTQDFTDASAGFTSDVKAAILIGCNATAADTATGQGHFRLGFAAATGGTTQVAAATISRVSGGNQDTGTNDTTSGECYVARTGSTTQSSAAAVDSWLSNGVRINWTNESEEHELVTALLLGGDIEARIVSATWASETTKTVAHGLSGAPEAIIAFRAVASGAQLALGFWASGGTYGYGNLYCADSANPTNVFSAANTDAIAAIMTTGSVTNRWTISNVDADSFDASTASTLSSGTLFFLCLRGTTSPIIAQAGVFATKTGDPGTEAEVDGMAAAPQVLLAIPTRLTSLGTLAGDSAYGLIASCNRAGTTEYGGVTLIEDDNVTPADGPPYSRTTADSALVLMDTTGAEDVVATVASWDTDGITLDYSNTGAAAYRIPYLAFGAAAAASGPAIDEVIPTTVRHGDTVTVVGSGFGATQGASTVTLETADGSPTVTQSVVSWSGTEITFTATSTALPFGALKVEVTVGAASDTIDIAHAAPSGHAWGTADVGWPAGTYSVFDGAAPAVVDGDQYEYEILTDQSAAVTVFPDGTFLIDASTGTHQFDVRVFDQTDETWSDWVTVEAEANVQMAPVGLAAETDTAFALAAVVLPATEPAVDVARRPAHRGWNRRRAMERLERERAMERTITRTLRGESDEPLPPALHVDVPPQKSPAAIAAEMAAQDRARRARARANETAVEAQRARVEIDRLQPELAERRRAAAWRVVKSLLRDL